MTKRQVLRHLNEAIKSAAELTAKGCDCNLCKTARRVQKQLKPVRNYLNAARS